MVATLTDDVLAGIITEQLPRLLSERPELRSSLYHLFQDALAEKTLAAKGDVVLLRQEMGDFRTETQANFNRLQTATLRGFEEMSAQMDLLGKRWGLRSEAVFRATVVSLLEDTFGATVEQRLIGSEEYDLVISKDGEHILVEIAASVKRNIQERLERKRALYIAETGVKPTRFILAVSHIYSRRAQYLREAGFEVIEPDEDDALA